MISKLRFLWRVAALAAALLLLASTVGAAQAPAPSSPAGSGTQTVFLGTPEFARLVKGKNVVITTADGKRTKCRVVSLSSTAVTVNPLHGNGSVDWDSTRSVPFDQIVKVEKGTNRVSSGALIGLGSGAAVGLAAWLLSAASEDGEGGYVVPMWAGIGAGAGAVIGSLRNKANPDRDVIYDASRRTTTLAISPILSPTRKGVAFSISWR